MYIIVEGKPYFWDCDRNLIFKAEIKGEGIDVDFAIPAQVSKNIEGTYTRDELLLFLSRKSVSSDKDLKKENTRLKRENATLKEKISKDT